MASSSSSFVPIGGSAYDVFLSFRGEDTRNNFIDHLYTALVQKGILVFKDDEMLRRGKPISPELLKAIERSRFAVVVFSKNYANSSWCLDELAKIMECQHQLGQKVLPVFYHVDPSDVRGQKRDFGTAFEKHEEKFRDKVKEWRKAMAAVGNLSGWHIMPNNGGEYSFISKIVQEISGSKQPRGLENNLIGIQSHMDKLNSLLDIEAANEVRMVGICGMGGIGKTTIARALFRRISVKFDGSSFNKGVRESSKRDICMLQQKILKDILEMNQEPVIKDREDGVEMIQTRLCNKKVLIVLDDVADDSQLVFIAGRHDWFGKGSRIIITTRDEHLLSDTYANYKPAFLDMQQAVELFSMHAFRRNCPQEGYKELSHRAVTQCGGLPLALEVLGSFLRGRTTSVWKGALVRLAKTLDDKIFETLKISFDGLENSEKKIFLDIACFFKGGHIEHVTRVLDSFGFDPEIGISVLIEKSLIVVSNECIDMHDLIQDMGWRLTRENNRNNRLWRPKEIRNVIEKNWELETIEAIVEKFDDNDRILFGTENADFRANVFENMKELRLLSISRKFTSSQPTSLPGELQWLRWDQYPFALMSIANMRKLVGLEMNICSTVVHLRMGTKVMPNLKFIKLWMAGLKRFPDISTAPNLEILILSECDDLVEVHNSLGSQERLVHLDMTNCFKLKCLPSLKMKSLETLNLDGCRSLEAFPEVSPCMVKLSTICLDRCSRLRYIPNSICELENLKTLTLRRCMQLQKLPKKLGSIKNLQELVLASKANNSTISYFLASTNLCCLRRLDLGGRQIKDEDFPNDLHAFSSLEELNLSDNHKLVQLPDSISHLSNLKYLWLNGCMQLQGIQALPSVIKVLEACDCNALEHIPNLTQEYRWLYKIWLAGCEKLLEGQESLVKILQESFLMDCAIVDLPLCILIPGNKIPSWFRKQRHGSEIAMELPPKSHATVMGFAVCGVFGGQRSYNSLFIKITFKIENNGKLDHKSEVDCINASATDVDEFVLIAYIPFSFLQQQMDDGFGLENWSLSVVGSLLISISAFVYHKEHIIRCGAHMVYKEDVESIQQVKACISDYCRSSFVCRSGNSLVYTERSGFEQSRVPRIQFAF